MDGLAQSVIHRHGPAHRNREPLLQRHFLAQADTTRHGLEAAHNPKVVGSIPAPPSTEAQVRAPALTWASTRSG